MGKSTISTGPFSIAMLTNYQRVLVANILTSMIFLASRVVCCKKRLLVMMTVDGMLEETKALYPVQKAFARV